MDVLMGGEQSGSYKLLFKSPWRLFYPPHHLFNNVANQEQKNEWIELAVGREPAWDMVAFGGGKACHRCLLKQQHCLGLKKTHNVFPPFIEMWSKTGRMAQQRKCEALSLNARNKGKTDVTSLYSQHSYNLIGARYRGVWVPAGVGSGTQQETLSQTRWLVRAYTRHSLLTSTWVLRPASAVTYRQRYFKCK